MIINCTPLANHRAELLTELDVLVHQAGTRFLPSPTAAAEYAATEQEAASGEAGPFIQAWALVRGIPAAEAVTGVLDAAQHCRSALLETRCIRLVAKDAITTGNREQATQALDVARHRLEKVGRR